MNKKIFSGIDIWGGLLVICSLYQLSGLINYGHYAFLYNAYPPNVILLRYFVSWAVKLLGLLSGIGIIYRKEIFRKTAIVGSLFTILTAGLQHTYAEFHQYTQYMDQHLLNSIAVPVEGFTFSAITGLAVIMARVLDIFFAGSLIYFFTRPEVKKHFEP